MTSPNERPRRRTGGRSARVRRAVLDAAIAILGEVGPDNFTIGEVATRAEVHETSIYRRWGRPDNLIVDAMLDNSAQIVPVPDTGTLRTDLIAVAQAVAHNLNEPSGAALMRMSALSVDEAFATARREFWACRLHAVSVIIERAITRGELTPCVDAEALLLAVIAPLHMLAMVMHEPIDEQLPERLVDLVLPSVSVP
jgi:AcrR family transcriptional regulator